MGAHSIVSGARSREMVAQMRDDHMPARFAYQLGGYGGGAFTVRRCSQRSRYCGGWLTGGVVIHVCVGLLGEELNPWGSERRLRPGWTKRQLERALSSLYMKAMREAHRRAHLKCLIRLANEVVPALASHDEVTLFSNEADVTEVYDEMTHSEITIWETWLRGIKSRTAKEATSAA